MMEEFSIQELKSTARSHVVDLVLTIAVALSIGAIDLWMVPYDRFFIERDESLSYPYEKGFANGEEIPTWLVLVLAGPLVAVLLVVARVVAWRLRLQRGDNGQDSDIHPKSLNIFVVLLAFIEAMCFTLFLTEFLKRFVGRKRPNFFAMCDYQGYRNGVVHPPYNLTEYFNLTTANVPGSLANCRATLSEVHEGMYSFPSGHSSSIWCGMGFLGIYSVYLFHYYTHKHNMAKGLLAMLYFFAACLISATRPRDYWHNFDDILAGAIIGFACSAFAFILNYSNVLSRALRLANDDEQTRLVEQVV